MTINKISQDFNYNNDDDDDDEDFKNSTNAENDEFNIQAQMISQKSAMSNMKAAMEKNKNLELEVQAENHSKEMEFMRNDLLQSHYLEFDDMKRLHEKELLTIKMELERAIEINKLKVSIIIYFKRFREKSFFV